MGIINKTVLMLTTATTLAFANVASATIVQFETSLGNFEVNLYDQQTPETVANFLEYVGADAYQGTIIHRSVPGFIVQGGGFTFDTAWPVSAISSNAPVVNEPVFANVRGTVAMAKLGGNPNSATNQWFFNLTNNTANLDVQNGGFTVFGEVTGDGMLILDAIADLPRYDFSASNGALGELPLQNFTTGNTPDDTNLIIINQITVIDAATDTAANLNPPVNTAPEPQPPASSSGGGALLVSLLGLFGLVSVRRLIRK